MLLTYNAPGGKEIWAAMSETERAAEEAEYRDLMQSMRDEESLSQRTRWNTTTPPKPSAYATVSPVCLMALR